MSAVRITAKEERWQWLGSNLGRRIGKEIIGRAGGVEQGIRFQLRNKVGMGAGWIIISRAIGQHADKALARITQHVNAVATPSAAQLIFKRRRAAITKARSPWRIGKDRKLGRGVDARNIEIGLQHGTRALLIGTLHSEAIDINRILCFGPIGRAIKTLD